MFGDKSNEVSKTIAVLTVAGMPERVKIGFTSSMPASLTNTYINM